MAVKTDPRSDLNFHAAPARQAVYKILSGLGVLVIPTFLNPEECADLRKEIDAAPGERAAAYRVEHSGNTEVVDPTAGAVLKHAVPLEAQERIRSLFVKLLPRAERHFRVPLVLREPLGFRTYGLDSFCVPHKDATDDICAPRIKRLRKIAVFLYLSTEAAAPCSGCHCGGSLVLYGLVPGQKTEKFGLCLPVTAGLLLLFPADVTHEVRPVLAGTRYAIGTFFWRADRAAEIRS